MGIDLDELTSRGIITLEDMNTKDNDYPSSSVGLAQVRNSSAFFAAVCNSLHRQNGGSRALKPKTLEMYKLILAAFESIDFEPISVRGVYYRVVSLTDTLPKTEKTYELIQRSVYDMRTKGLLDFYLIIDGTRFRQKPSSYSDLEEFANRQSKLYRRSLWEDSEYYVELAVEKDAMKSILYEITSEYDISLISTKGFSSLTFWYTTAETFKWQRKQGKHPVLLMMTDFDEAGRNMKSSAIKTLRNIFGLEEGYHYDLVDVAVTEHQIEAYDLPLRPEKNKNSTVDYAVEIDAFKPKDIREILEVEVLKYIDADELAGLRELEKLERDSIPEALKNLKLG